MAEAVVSFAVERLGDELIRQRKFLAGVGGQVKQMQTELKLMQSFLKDADKRQDDDETVRVWVSKIREVAYHAEAVIETFALKIASRRGQGIRNAFKRSHLSYSHLSGIASARLWEVRLLYPEE